MKERTLRGRARPLPAAAVVVLWVIACCCRLESARGFNLRVDEQFRVENVFKQPINFIINGQEASSLQFLKTSDLARFGEQYTYIAMEWNRSPNEMVDYIMYFASENTTIMETPQANTPYCSCVPSTNYTSFRMSLPCTGNSDEAVAFEVFLNYTITTYPYTIDNIKANLSFPECHAHQRNLTGGHVTKGSTVVSMVKICALATPPPPVGDDDNNTGLSTPKLAGLIAGSVATLFLVILLILIIVRYQRRKTQALVADAGRLRIESIMTQDRYHTHTVPLSPVRVRHQVGEAVFEMMADRSVIVDKPPTVAEVKATMRTMQLAKEQVKKQVREQVKEPVREQVKEPVREQVKEPVREQVKELAIKTESDVDEFLEETQETRTALTDAGRLHTESIMTRDRCRTHIVPCSAVQVGREIGRGAFGRVYIGNVILDKGKEPVLCAIKTLKAIKTESDVDEFLEEAVMLKDFKHPNVMSLLAVASNAKNLPMVCLEYMHYGDLRTYLRKMRGSVANLVNEANTTSSTKVLLSFCTQVAQGMDYLSSKNFVHRDLAARNCMLNKDMVVKVGDFGLAREIEKDSYYRIGSSRPLPVKWMSFESLKEEIFTVQSDVWAFGVVMWEIFSLGITPYSGVANHEMLELLKQNIRLPPPDDCPVGVYDMMQSCWVVCPEERPTFSLIAGILDDFSQQLYENMPIHKVQAWSDYMNYNPAPPGSIIQQKPAKQPTSRTAENPPAPYIALLEPDDMDQHGMMGPAQKKLELATVAETSPSDQPTVENQATGSGESAVLVIDTMSPREINPVIATTVTSINTNSIDGGNNNPPPEQQAPDAIVPPLAISESIITE
ncbi:hepatocyte growth factor receptor-like [Sycon ciliatum]|uniref:hepatocyte growth factor receptor-like n=1 Tax=Sycon ciliatum TaxID=27933 RepID=UPI0031F62B69